MDGNIQKYIAFVRTVELGSFSKAADALGYSQSSVSKMIADLEQEWGLELLERNRSGLQLTSEGRILLPVIREMIDSYQHVRDTAAELRGVHTGMIHIGLFSSVATHWIPSIIREFQQDYPNIQYELLIGDYDEIERWVEEGRVECGFVTLPAKTELDTVVLERDEMVAVLPKNHPLAKKTVLDPGDLEGEPFLLLSHGGRTDVTAFLEEHDVHPDIAFTTWDDYSILAMAESGLGIGILPSLILRRIPYEVEIRSFSCDFYREIGLAMRPHRRVSAAVKQFMKYLEYRN